DTGDRCTGASEWNQETARAATELEGAAAPPGEFLPESKIAPAHRARVLPVVERRVLIPTHNPQPATCNLQSIRREKTSGFLDVGFTRQECRFERWRVRHGRVEGGDDPNRRIEPLERLLLNDRGDRLADAAGS